MKKNIVVILLDGCRAQSLGCYGYSLRDTSPNIDDLAQNALIALRNYSTSFCTMPSVISMMTGIYPCLHRGASTVSYYDGAYPFLTDILRSHGYETFGVSNSIAAMSPEWGFIRGYDKYYRVGKEDNWFKASKEEQRGVKKPKLKTKILRTLFQRLKKHAPDLSSDVQNKALIAYYESTDMGGQKAVECFQNILKTRNKSKPFFTYVNLPDTHHPWLAKQPFNNMWGKLNITDNLMKLMFSSGKFYEDGDLSQEEIVTLQVMYDTCVRYSDHLVGQIVDMTKKHEIFDQTIFLLVGDHGGMTYETRQLYGSTCFTYEPEIHVPFILVDHGQKRQLDSLTSVIDVFPTILDVAGIPLDTVSLCHGKSILGENAGHSEVLVDYPSYPEWLARMVKTEPEILLRFGKTNRTMITDHGEKMIWVNTGLHERYDLISDPLEKENLFDCDEKSLALIEQMKFKYQQILGPSGKNLECYRHSDVGSGLSELPPLATVNKNFDPKSIQDVER